jgi:protein-(glutamine-N5) methyltransferase, release factor-specific
LPKLTISDWLTQATTQLKRCDFINNARLEAELLMSFVLRCDRLQLQLRLNDHLDNDQISTLNQILAQRLDNCPLAYITSSKEFYGRLFQVSPAVLIPRPESEVMIEQALQIVNNNFIVQPSSAVKILDVGCGSGALGLTLASELAQRGIDYQLTLADISVSALDIARHNAQALHITADFVISDLLKDIPQSSFDFILANLPYVDRQWSFIKNVDFEPELALYADNKGLALIFQLIDQLVSMNNDSTHGWLLLESDPIQQSAISKYLLQRNFTNIKQVDYITVVDLKR